MITYNLEAVKPELIDWIKSEIMDFCTDMFVEIKNAAIHKSPDDIEMHLNMIRTAEQLSLDYTKIINEAVSITDILRIADEDMMCNVFYEREDEILSKILNTKVGQTH